MLLDERAQRTPGDPEPLSRAISLLGRAAKGQLSPQTRAELAALLGTCPSDEPNAVIWRRALAKLRAQRHASVEGVQRSGAGRLCIVAHGSRDLWARCPDEKGHTPNGRPFGLWKCLTNNYVRPESATPSKPTTQAFSSQVRALSRARQRERRDRRAANQPAADKSDAGDPPQPWDSPDAYVQVLVPSAALRFVVPPRVCVTQDSVEDVVGMPREAFMAAARQGLFPADKEGKRWKARTEDVVRYWAPKGTQRVSRAQSAGAVVAESSANKPPSGEPSVEDEVARLTAGLQRRPGSNKNG